MLNTQIEPSTFSGYSSMNIRLICFFQDNCEKLPGIINPDLMENLVVADCQWFMMFALGHRLGVDFQCVGLGVSIPKRENYDFILSYPDFTFCLMSAGV